MNMDDSQNKVNKRIVKHMLKQATEFLPDIPPPAVSEDVATNYNGLVKSLNNILLNLQEIYVYQFNRQPEGEADYPYEEEEDETEYGPEWGVGSEGLSEGSYHPSRVSYASIGSGRKKKRAGARRAGSEGSELTMMSVPSVASQPFYRPRDVRSEASSSRASEPFFRARDVMSELTDPYMGLEEPSIPEGRRKHESPLHNPYVPLLLNNLTRETVNAKFYAEQLNFSQLTKIQKQKIKHLLVRIDKPMRLITRIRELRPVSVNLVELLNMIKDTMTSEGSSQEYIPRTEAEMPQEAIGELEGFAYGGGRICGSTTSVFGAGKRKLLSPAMYNAHNVNQNFNYSLSKRNR